MFVCVHGFHSLFLLRCLPVVKELQPTLTFLNKQAAEKVHVMVAKMIYSLNMPFNSVDNKQFQHLVEVRPMQVAHLLAPSPPRRFWLLGVASLRGFKWAAGCWTRCTPMRG